MTWPVPESKRISAGFNQMRPLSRPENERTHVHGAVDIPAPAGYEIVAPERGRVVCLSLMRISREIGANRIPPLNMDFNIRDHYYFYDIYGGVVILLADSGRTHVMTHSWRNQMFNLFARPQGGNVRTVESGDHSRFPAICGEISSPIMVHECETIGYVGNAGFSTGPHVHYEIHPGRVWKEHNKRINPEEVFDEAQLVH